MLIWVFIWCVGALVSQDMAGKSNSAQNTDTADIAPSRQSTALVDLNSATPAELERLPGIGPVLAIRIVEHRPYRSIEELARVPGIGEKIILQLKPLVKTEVSTPD
ncbi:MAG TPA: DNA-binding protein [Verrucomicrobiales bacterium]|nr:DNA-binding protein [Verrucomicrobiales bacterium]